MLWSRSQTIYPVWGRGSLRTRLRCRGQRSMKTRFTWAMGKKHKRRRQEEEGEEDLPSRKTARVEGESRHKHKKKKKKSKHKENNSNHQNQTRDCEREFSSVASIDTSQRGVVPPAPEDGRCGHVLQVDDVEFVLDESDKFGKLHEKWVRGTKAELDRLREQTGSWRLGRWSKDEVEQLKRNVSEFMKEHNIDDVSDVMSGGRYSSHQELYKYIAKNINRPLVNVYRKMTRVCDSRNYVGRWTEEQEQELMRLHSLHGDRWALIGRTLEMTAEAVRSKYRQLRNNSTGHWTREEEQNLIEAMRELSGEDEEVLVEDLPPTATWEDVASLVKTRNAYQCREKWMMKLCSGTEGEKWGVADSVRLLRELANQNADDEDSVQWESLCKGWSAAHSRSHLRTKWTSLRRQVPNYRIKTFQDCLDYLLEYRLPALERSLNKLL